MSEIPIFPPHKPQGPMPDNPPQPMEGWHYVFNPRTGAQVTILQEFDPRLEQYQRLGWIVW